MILYILAGIVVSFVFAAIGAAPRRKKIPEQKGAPQNVIPFGNDRQHFERRAGLRNGARGTP